MISFDLTPSCTVVEQLTHRSASAEPTVMDLPFMANYLCKLNQLNHIEYQGRNIELAITPVSLSIGPDCMALEIPRQGKNIGWPAPAVAATLSCGPSG